MKNTTNIRKAAENFTLQTACYQQLFEKLLEAIVILDKEDRIIKTNKRFEMVFGYSQAESRGRLINELIIPPDLIYEKQFLLQSLTQGQSISKETERRCKDGRLINVLLIAFPIVVDNRNMGICAIYSDITARKIAEEKLNYLNLHDPLTGLFNRTFFEQQLRYYQQIKQIDLGLILCDVDSLKIVNDTLGHDKGDSLLLETASIIKKCIGVNDTASRFGGDEFAVFLPNTSIQTMQTICKQIEDTVSAHNKSHRNMPLNLSLGYALAKKATGKRLQEMFREADNNMYRKKLLHNQNKRSFILKKLIKNLEKIDYFADGHTQRLQYLIIQMALYLDLPEKTIEKLKLLAQFHDIGKVGISRSILFKRTPLTEREYQELKRHSEIGHRIAQSTPDLVPINDWILKHHEHWDGNGYPLGLKGTDIPLACRIFTIADAYDAIISNRPYRKALTHQQALNELLTCSGTQFDPSLVTAFTEVIDFSKL